MSITVIADDHQRVIDQALRMLKRTSAGRAILRDALRSAAFGFEQNAMEYAHSDAFDPDEQARLSRLAHEMADALTDPQPHEHDADSIDDIPF